MGMPKFVRATEKISQANARLHWTMRLTLAVVLSNALVSPDIMACFRSSSMVTSAAAGCILPQGWTTTFSEVVGATTPITGASKELSNRLKSRVRQA